MLCCANRYALASAPVMMLSVESHCGCDQEANGVKNRGLIR
jgi:hypothetical protein